MICKKIWDFLVARGKKLGARGHQGLLEYNPKVAIKWELKSFKLSPLLSYNVEHLNVWAEKK